jgi:hypothetical protein
MAAIEAHLQTGAGGSSSARGEPYRPTTEPLPSSAAAAPGADGGGGGSSRQRRTAVQGTDGARRRRVGGSIRRPVCVCDVPWCARVWLPGLAVTSLLCPCARGCPAPLHPCSPALNAPPTAPTPDMPAGRPPGSGCRRSPAAARDGPRHLPRRGGWAAPRGRAAGAAAPPAAAQPPPCGRPAQQAGSEAATRAGTGRCGCVGRGGGGGGGVAGPVGVPCSRRLGCRSTTPPCLPAC